MAEHNTNEELDLEYTKSKRKQLIEALSKNGAPTDIKEQSIMLQALDGLDRQTLTKMRIKVDEGISNTQVAAAAILAQLFNSPKTKAVGRSDEIVTTIPVIREDLPAVTLVAGELDVMVIKDNYDGFMKRNGFEEV